MEKIKKGTIILAIILVTMIAFFGVYLPVQNRMENQIKNYSYAMDIKGSRNIRLKVNTNNESVIKDAEGNVVEDATDLTEEQMKEKGYTNEETPINAEEVKTVENYRASQKIIEKRLEKLGFQNYIVKVDEQNGDILIELLENDDTDKVISNINTTGKFEIIDSQTKEVLMNNQDIKQARVMYGSGNSMSTQGTSVYLDIEFNKEGTKKLEEISNQYKKQDTSSQENETSEDENSKEETNTEKTITMNIDSDEIMSTSFEEPIRTGKLQLSVGSATTDTKTLQEYIDQASNMAIVLDTDKLPIVYELDENQYVLSDITENEIQIAEYIALGILFVAILILIIRFKVKGILGAVSYIGWLSIFLLVIRYANVILSIEGLLAILVVGILNYILINKLIARNKLKETYQNFFVKIIPVIILSITFCFFGWMQISSFGMVMFWGIVLIAVYNLIVTNRLLKIKAGKEK